jgi:hypothetical protein
MDPALIHASSFTQNVMPGELYNNRHLFDSRKLIDEEYQCSYGQLKTVNTICGNVLYINIERGNYDMIDSIDLVTSNLSNIKSISFEIGAQQIDIFNSGDIKTQVDTLCALYRNNRRTTKNVIPLEFLLLHSNNVYIHLSLQYHDSKVVVEFYKEVQDCSLYGNMYFLNDRESLCNKPIFNYGIQSYSYSNLTIKKGTNTYILDNCIPPSSLLYFWGFDKTLVKKITLQLDNGKNYYNGTIETLEYRKNSLGFTFEPVVIFFTTQEFTKYPSGNLNLRQMRNPQLIIETDQSRETSFYLVNIGARGVQYNKGMCSLI